jgi:hypothetical protein
MSLSAILLLSFPHSLTAVRQTSLMIFMITSLVPLNTILSILPFENKNVSSIS